MTNHTKFITYLLCFCQSTTTRSILQSVCVVDFTTEIFAVKGNFALGTEKENTAHCQMTCQMEIDENDEICSEGCFYHLKQ